MRTIAQLADGHHTDARVEDIRFEYLQLVAWDELGVVDFWKKPGICCSCDCDQWLDIDEELKRESCQDIRKQTKI